jgi:hypothetical protein
MDANQSVLVHFIKEMLRQHRTHTSHTAYTTHTALLQRGAKLLWRNYFRYADAEDQTTSILEPLSAVVARLCQDLQKDTEEMRCIRAYGARFGLPLIKN